MRTELLPAARSQPGSYLERVAQSGGSAYEIF
jgi:hypothetical protein